MTEAERALATRLALILEDDEYSNEGKQCIRDWMAEVQTRAMEPVSLTELASMPPQRITLRLAQGKEQIRVMVDKISTYRNEGRSGTSVRMSNGREFTVADSVERIDQLINGDV